MDNINEDYEKEKKAHPENFTEYGVCEKCGGDTYSKLIGDESYNYCGDCGWVTP